MSVNFDELPLFGVGVVDGVGTCEGADEDGDLIDTEFVMRLGVADSDAVHEEAGAEVVVTKILERKRGATLPDLSVEKGGALESNETVVSTAASTLLVLEV